MPFSLLAIPVLSTLAGGLIALRFRRSLELLIALGTGLLLGAAFLDLLPEALSLSPQSSALSIDVLTVVLLSFLLFFSIQNALEAMAARWSDPSAPQQASGRIGGAMLIFHSLRDGMAIGLSYAASHKVGYVVAAGIAAHDVGDGMNTIIVTTRDARNQLEGYLFLAADSLAPLAGGLLTIWWTFSARGSSLLLAVAAGFFLQMATCEFLPELRRPAIPRWHLVLCIFLGASAIYAANLLMQTLH